MATNLTPDEMRAMVDEHSVAEVTRDGPRAIATMTDAPVYEFYPYRLRIAGAEAIVEMWRRLLPLPCFDASGITFVAREEYAGEDSLVHMSEWIFTAPDGGQRRTNFAVRYGFDGDRMLSETMFMDHALTAFTDDVFDDRFRSLPRVEVI